MLPSIFWFSTVHLHFGHGWVHFFKIISNPDIHISNVGSAATTLVPALKPCPPPAAAACVCTRSVCRELPLHVCHGQASVCWGWKSPGRRNRLKHGAGNGRVSNPQNIVNIDIFGRETPHLVHEYAIKTTWLCETTWKYFFTHFFFIQVA